MSLVDNVLNTLINFGLRIPGALLALVGGYIVIAILSKILQRVFTFIRIEPTMAGLLLVVARVAMWIITGAAVLQALGLNEVALALSGSIALVALALATSAKDTVADILAGIFLVSDNDFKTGFKITTNSLTGRIRAVDLRKTRIIGEDGKTYVIPNKDVEGHPWTVEERTPTRFDAKQEAA